MPELRSAVKRVILYSAQSLPTSSNAMAVRCYHLALAMSSAGINVDLWSHTSGIRTTPLYSPFPSNRFPTSLRLLAEVLLSVELVLRLAWRRLRTPDVVVILSSPPFVSCFLAAQACRVLGLRFVFDARDVYPEVLFNFGIISASSRVGRWLARATKAIYDRALFVSTPSEAFVETIRAQVAAPDRVVLVRNGYDDRLFRPPSVPKDGGEFVCVVHGLLGRMHNIRLLLEVADRVVIHREVRFVVIGYGPKEELIRANPQANVEFLGERPYAQIPALLAIADMGLAFIEDTAGTDGAFPVKVYEYIGAGLPVLVTPRSEAARLVERLRVGKAFGNQDADEIARTIVKCARRDGVFAEWRDALRRTHVELSRSHASNQFAEHLKSVAFDQPTD